MMLDTVVVSSLNKFRAFEVVTFTKVVNGL
jgi:hypothetical protein